LPEKLEAQPKKLDTPPLIEGADDR